MTERVLVSLDEMAERLGWEGKDRGRRLRRYLVKRQQQGGGALVILVSGKGRAQRYRTSESLLRMRAPELFGRRLDELQMAFASHLAAVDARIVRRVDERLAEQVEPRLAELDAVTTTLADAVGRLTLQTEQVAVNCVELAKRM